MPKTLRELQEERYRQIESVGGITETAKSPPDPLTQALAGLGLTDVALDPEVRDFAEKFLTDDGAFTAPFIPNIEEVATRRRKEISTEQDQGILRRIFGRKGE